MRNDTKRRPRGDRPLAPNELHASQHDVFTVQEAARVAGIPARSINFWTGPARVLKPDQAYRGRGSAKRFSRRNLVQLRVIFQLAQRRVSLASMRGLMAQAEHSRGFGDDWFGMVPQGDSRAGQLPTELLTGARSGSWRWWVFPPETLGILEEMGLRKRRHRTEPPSKAESFLAHFEGARGDHKQRNPSAFFVELFSETDVVLVNLGRIKADLAARLGKGR